MTWRVEPGYDPSDPQGVGVLLERAGTRIGGPPLTGTRFLHDASGMLTATREIEASVFGVPTTLYVGFQDPERFEETREIYQRLASSGPYVIGFGTGQPSELPRGIRWVEVGEDANALENQWFLLAEEPRPVGLVGYETSPAELRGEGPAAAPGRTWEGFMTGDRRLVRELIDHLETVRAERG